MFEDNRKQTSEPNRARVLKGTARSSDLLSSNKIVYIALALTVIVVGVIEFSARTKSTKVAPESTVVTQPQTPAVAPPKTSSTGTTISPAPKIISQPERRGPRSENMARSAPIQKASAPTKRVEPAPLNQTERAQGNSATEATEISADSREDRPVLRRPGSVSPRSVALRARPTTASAEVKPTLPATKEISVEEKARQEQAREIVIQKSPAQARLLTNPDSTTEYKGWQAEAEVTDTYLVTFTFIDKSSGTSIQYVWRVNSAARTILPLSYYARRLSTN